MTTYKTMTVSGGYGSDVLAADDDDAVSSATALGYTVLDIVEHGDDLVLVIAD